VEAAVYACATRAAAAAPPPDSAELSADGADLVLTVRGVTAERADVQGIVDRVEAAGGCLVADGGVLVLRVPAGVELAPYELVSGGQPGL